MLKDKEGMWPAIVLTVISVLTALLLSLTYGATKDVIAANAQEEAQKSMRILFPAADGFESLDVDFSAMTGINGMHKALKGGELVGYVVMTEGLGYAGQVPVIMGFNLDQTLSGISISNTAETPGYGKKAEEPGFLAQFQGMPASSEFSFSAEAGKTPFDQVSGATITSIAIRNALNNGFNALKATGLYGEPAAPGKASAYTWADVADRFQALLPGADSFEAAPASTVPGIGGIWEAKKAGETLGYAMVSESKGFVGTIPLLVAFNPDKTLAGVSIQGTQETEGYGKAVEEAAFLAQFKGLPGDKEFTLTEEAGKTSFDGVSGATMTSLAVRDALNQAIQALSELKTGVPAAPAGAKYKLADFQDQFKKLFPAADSFADGPLSTVEGIGGIWEAKTGSVSLGYLVISDGDGFARDFPVVAAFNPDKTLAGVSIQGTAETEGYGKAVEEAAFLKQFKGLPGDREFTLRKEAGKTSFDGISGATVTSVAVRDALNNAVKAIQALGN